MQLHYFSANDRKLSGDQLKKRYRELVKIYHPDKGGSNQAMHAIQKEYEYLQDPKRAKKVKGSAGGFKIVNSVITFTFLDKEISYDLSKLTEEDLEEMFIQAEKLGGVSFSEEFKVSVRKYHRFAYAIFTALFR